MRSAPAGFCPPAPDPLSRPLGPFALLNALANNPIECWTKAHFEEPIVMGGFPFARVAVVTDPAAIRQILVENPSDYGKSALERRILCAHLRDGLVAVEGEQWRRQRQALAPWFSRKTVMHFAPEMALAAAALVERWQNHLDDDVVDIKAEMSRLSLDVLVRCIFSRGLGDDPNAFRTAMMSFFATAVRIDPFDLVGLPDFVPRITRLRLRPMLERFNRDFNFNTALPDRRRSRSSAR
jgi:cytochrome P450